MVWRVSRDEGDFRPTGKVLVEADYELLDDEEAVKLAGAILDVANRQIYCAEEGGGRWETQAAYTEG